MKEYFKKHKVHLTAWVFFAVLKIIAAVLFALYMQKMIDAVSAMDAEKMLHTSIAGVVIVVCYAAFGYVSSYFETKRHPASTASWQQKSNRQSYSLTRPS